MKPTSGTDVMRAVASLCERGLVLIPTETRYMLACNATDAEALSRLFAASDLDARERPEIFAASTSRMRKLVADLPQACLTLAERFTPGLLTYLLPARPMLCDAVCHPDRKVAIRVPAHPLTQSLLEMCAFPLAVVPMPAEVRGTVTAAAAAEAFKDVVGYVLDGGPSSLGMDATVVSFEPDAIVLHRKGAVTARSMEMETHMIVVNSISPIIPVQEEAIVVPFRAPAR